MDSFDLPDISKFSFLTFLREGEAKQAIQGLSLTACKLLSDIFGHKKMYRLHTYTNTVEHVISQ